MGQSLHLLPSLRKVVSEHKIIALYLLHLSSLTCSLQQTNYFRMVFVFCYLEGTLTSLERTHQLIKTALIYTNGLHNNELT